MMKKIFTFIFAMTAGIGSLAAQGGGYLGSLPYFSGFWIERMHGLSGKSAGMGTTRSAAMGGAFTSLGADLSSMHINPAGLGMYRNSEFGITFGPTVGEVTNSMNNQNSVKDSRTGFALNSFGAAFNLFEGSQGLTSFTFGVGYQRMADYNYRSRMNIDTPAGANGGYWSILDAWSTQMDRYAARIGIDALGDSNLDWFGTSNNAARLYEYGAAMAASPNPGMIVPNLSDGYFHPQEVLSPTAGVSKHNDMLSKGSQGEYAFSAGVNLSNEFYFGVTLGIADLYQDRTSTYGETYSNNTASAPVNEIRYIQRMRTTGTGFNGKFGFIWRPDPALRVGATLHTPTIMDIRNRYSTSLDALYANGDSPYIDVNEQEYQERYFTPARLMVGVSGTIAGRAILSADWEQTYYDGMAVWSDLYSQSQIDEYRTAVKQYFTTGNTVRLGAEVMATDMLFLRAGWQWSDHGVRKTPTGRDAAPLNSTVCYNSNIASVGFGVKIGANASFDMTYSMGNYKYTGYNLFYSSDDFGTPNNLDDDRFFFPGASHTDFTRPKLTRHNIMLGLNFRF